MRKLNNEEICKYLIRSGKVKERRERMRQISDCLINFTGEKNGYEPLRKVWSIFIRRCGRRSPGKKNQKRSSADSSSAFPSCRRKSRISS